MTLQMPTLEATWDRERLQWRVTGGDDGRVWHGWGLTLELAAADWLKQAGAVRP
jgi:hypothetical protein